MVIFLQNRRQVCPFPQVIEISDIFEDMVRLVKRLPKVMMGLRVLSWTLRALFCFNIITSILPLVRPRARPLTTIPLSSVQRELIGLDKTGNPPQYN
jgi:hypothetical protein